ncbi:ROK family protein [Oceanobacillus jeddahense]|uniref:ROK family protein n=1 Tax=Oceanobacillus jeddahense TaxID=1462527 RepID=A0ABY5JRK1_9BACI|nr:ROK family protein [Oceanobacillus jeddahense]UUI02931.1 ROK family protein [Oceanobacillus jeddahense]
MAVLGVDLGGTSIKIGVFEQAGIIKEKFVFPTKEPVYESLEAAIETVMSKHSGVKAIGIGTPGFVDREKGRIIFASENLPGWSGTEVKKQLESKFHLSVIVENDANVATLAEVNHGSAKNYKSALMLTLGTGVGGGVVIDNKILYGPHGAVGEFGHMILYPEGHECNCGRRGCQEQYVSGHSIERRIREAGLDVTPLELMQMKEQSMAAQEIINDFTYNLALSISSLQAAFDMEVLILGGGVSHSAGYWMDDLNKHLKDLLFHPLEVAIAELKNDAGIVGAAALVFIDERKETVTFNR